MKKKKLYQSPFIMAISVEMQGLLMTNSLHGSQHEGFTESTNPPPVIDDGTDDDSPW